MTTESTEYQLRIIENFLLGAMYVIGAPSVQDCFTRALVRYTDEKARGVAAPVGSLVEEKLISVPRLDGSYVEIRPIDGEDEVTLRPVR